MDEDRARDLEDGLREAEALIAEYRACLSDPGRALHTPEALRSAIAGLESRATVNRRLLSTLREG